MDQIKVRVEQTLDPNLFAVILEQPALGMNTGDTVDLVTEKQTKKMNLVALDMGMKDSDYIYSRRELTHDALYKREELLKKEMNELYIDSRDGSRKSMNAIIRERGEPSGRLLMISRLKLTRSYFLKWDSGPVQGGISSLIFDSYQVPIEIKNRL